MTKHRCPSCYFGRLSPAKVIYLQPHGTQMIVAPDFPAQVCDLCDYTEYDELYIMQLDMLLTSPSHTPSVGRHLPVQVAPQLAVTGRKPPDRL